MPKFTPRKAWEKVFGHKLCLECGYELQEMDEYLPDKVTEVLLDRLGIEEKELGDFLDFEYPRKKVKETCRVCLFAKFLEKYFEEKFQEE